MPTHNSGRVEYAIDSGHVSIVTDKGQQVPAYWAHPRMGSKFSGICLLHDWWGLNDVARILANFYAQMGYYVIAPDMYLGELAHNPKQAMMLLDKNKEHRFDMVDAALSVLETHHRVNARVAAVGIGMGGTLAFEAAIKRDDLEAAVSYAGFPQQYLGEFAKSNTPILAVYGSKEPYTNAKVIHALRQELATTPLRDKHRLIIIEGAEHEFFTAHPDPNSQLLSREVISQSLDFLEQYIEKPKNAEKTKY